VTYESLNTDRINSRNRSASLTDTAVAIRFATAFGWLADIKSKTVVQANQKAGMPGFVNTRLDAE